MTIRDVKPERDADALAALIRSANPAALINAASWLHSQLNTPARAEHRTWIAEVDGEIAGRSLAFKRFWGGTAASLYVTVRADHRGQGIGAALYDLAFAYAASFEPSAIVTDFYETDAGVRFAEARGFRETRAEQLSTVDPRTVSEQPGAEVRPLTEVDLHVAHHIDNVTTNDVPQHEPIEAIPYDEWEQFVLEEPLFQVEGSFVAYADGEPAALSLLLADLENGRAVNMYTGTLREFRGRGLGTAAKLASIHWAASRGITHMSTNNDETNAPMLAINRRLGYEPLGRRVEFSRDATSAPPPSP